MKKLGKKRKWVKQMYKTLTLPLSQELKILAALANVDAQSAFLGLAIEALEIVGHKLTDTEKYGFYICMNSLRDNVKCALKSGGKI